MPQGKAQEHLEEPDPVAQDTQDIKTSGLLEQIVPRTPWTSSWLAPNQSFSQVLRNAKTGKVQY